MVVPSLFGDDTTLSTRLSTPGHDPVRVRKPLLGRFKDISAQIAVGRLRPSS